MTERPSAPEDDLPEQMRVRLDKRAELLERKTPPYALGFRRTHTLAELRAAYPDLEPGAETGDTVAVAGRVIFLRNTGKLCFVLLRAGDGSWTANGEPQPHVQGALDCDLAFSPLTNFMPARRLAAAPGDHVMAWVSVPDLAVLRSEQRYEPIDALTVRYIGLDSDFTADLELDEDGFVVRYQRLAERVVSGGRA